MDFKIGNTVSKWWDGITSPSHTYLDEAKAKTGGKLGLLQTSFLDLGQKGAVAPKNALFVCAPRMVDGYDVLREFYQIIFSKAADNKATLLLIPALSTTGSNGYPHTEAALIALEEAGKFLMNNSDDTPVHIMFVIDQSEDKRHCDEANAAAYQSALDQFALTCSDKVLAQLSCIKSQIQYLPGDVVVVPVGPHYQSAGYNVYKAIESAARQTDFHTPITSQILPESFEVKDDSLEASGLASEMAEANGDIPQSNWHQVFTTDLLSNLLPHLTTSDVKNLLGVTKNFTKDTLWKHAGMTKESLNYFDSRTLGPFVAWHDEREFTLQLRGGVKTYLSETGLKFNHHSGRFANKYTTSFSTEELGKLVGHIPIRQKWLPAVGIIRELPKFLVLRDEQAQSKQLICAEHSVDVSVQNAIFKKYCEDDLYREQVELIMAYDEIDNAVVPKEEIRALKAGFVSDKTGHSGQGYVYVNVQLSPMAIFTMQILNVFCFPIIITADNEQQNIEECKDSNLKGPNVVLKIELNDSARVRTVPGQSKTLLMCNSPLKYQNVYLDQEKNLLVLSVTTTKETGNSLPPGFDAFRQKRGEIAITSQTYAEQLDGNLKKFQDSFKRNFPHVQLTVP